MKKEENEINRIWIEINEKNLEHNIEELEKNKSEETKIMAVVKANAYGHGIACISKKLESLGIEDFAVATLQEGIDLRKNNVKGNILILGFTHFNDLKYVNDYDLMQTIIDYDYAEKIKTLGLKEPVKCHIKIDTGMHRIGENYKNTEKLYSIYENGSLEILGTYSHLCSSDSLEDEDVRFTDLQINRFENCIKKLREKGYNTGKIHLQSSYGFLNYPLLHYDYIRIGILLFGVRSFKEKKERRQPDLHPVLSLKARVCCVKEIGEGESVGYGRAYIAETPKKIATLSIGYADGIPRNLADAGLKIKIKNQFAPVIGRICTHQCMADVTEIPDICIGDVATVIGSDKEICAEEVSQKANTMTPELLSRLEPNIKRIII